MIIENWQTLLLEHLSATMLEFIIGFTITIIGGVTLLYGCFIQGLSKNRLSSNRYFANGSDYCPVPIFVMWFGYTIWGKVAVTVLFSFFPIVVSTYDGLKSCDKEYIELYRSMGASRFQLFKKLHIPIESSFLFLGIEVSGCLCISRCNDWRVALARVKD